MLCIVCVSLFVVRFVSTCVVLFVAWFASTLVFSMVLCGEDNISYETSCRGGGRWLFLLIVFSLL
jgi:hypothetical protein